MQFGRFAVGEGATGRDVKGDIDGSVRCHPDAGVWRGLRIVSEAELVNTQRTRLDLREIRDRGRSQHSSVTLPASVQIVKHGAGESDSKLSEAIDVSHTQALEFVGFDVSAHRAIVQERGH